MYRKTLPEVDDDKSTRTILFEFDEDGTRGRLWFAQLSVMTAGGGMKVKKGEDDGDDRGKLGRVEA